MKKQKELLLSFIVLLGLWYLAAYLFQTQTIPYPHELLLIMQIDLIKRILGHLFVSLYRVIMGMIIVMVIGIPIGVMMGMNKRFNTFFQGFVHLLYPIPKVAFLPMILVIFGIGGQSAIVMVVLILFFQIVVQIRDSVKSVTREQRNGVRALGATQRHILFHVVGYAILPGVFTWMRLGLGTALAVLFFTENIASDAGIGFYILDTWSRIAYKEMALAIVFLSAAGMGLFFLIAYAERKILQWQPKVFD